MTTLSLRALNRATLDRQLLLRRHPLTAQQTVRHLAGLQGQAPLAPYVGLWTRLSAFTADDLSLLITERAVLRAAVLRGTVHVVDTADYVAFRPLFTPLLTAVLETNFRRNLGAADPAEVARCARELLAGQPLTRAQIGRHSPPAGRTPTRWPSPTRQPTYDNLLLSHADRSRVIPHDRQPPLWPGNGATQGTLLIDGQWNALWKITKEKGTAAMTVSPFRPLTQAEQSAIAEEAARLLAFTCPGHAHDVRIPLP